MTRSSWHHYWRLMTGFSAILCVFFVFVVAGSSRAAQGQEHLLAGEAVPLFYVLLAQELARIAAVFWGIASVAFGLAWWACAMALAERKEGLGVVTDREEALQRIRERRTGPVGL